MRDENEQAKKGNVNPDEKVFEQSLQREKGGGFSIHAARMMAEPLGGKPAECTLIGQCRTFVFEFPRSELLADQPSKHYVIYEKSGMRAGIVGDLRAYFEKEPAGSLHFDISVSFRAAVRSLYEKSLERQERTARELFLVIEEFTEFPPIEMSGEQCFSIDEVRDGEAVIVGGRQGERALLAFPALGCPWPRNSPDMYRVNVILAAVKAVQNVTGHIRQLDESSCFVSSKREAVYTLSLSMSASGVAVSRLTPQELEQRSSYLEAMVESMMLESDPTIAEVIDSIVLDKSTDDGYLRLSYLRLWQAVEDARRHLGQPELLNEKDAIAGDRGPTELKSYRNAIAHWHTGRMDQSYLSDLQYTALELLRRKYGGNPEPDR